MPLAAARATARTAPPPTAMPPAGLRGAGLESANILRRKLRETVDDTEDPLVTDAVDDRHPVPFIGNEPGIPQNREMLGDVRLRPVEHRREVHDVGPLLAQELEDAKPYRMGEDLGHGRGSCFVVRRFAHRTTLFDTSNTMIPRVPQAVNPGGARLVPRQFRGTAVFSCARRPLHEAVAHRDREVRHEGVFGLA